MKTLNLKHFPSFKREGILKNLNELVEHQKELMPHQVAVAAGCTLDEAMGILMLLTADEMAEAYLLVYHTTHDNSSQAPIMARKLTEGFPETPFTCDDCGQEINSTHNLRYDFLFKIKEDMQFIYTSE